MLVELFRFSEQSDLDVGKLTHKLGETSGSANVLAVSLLLPLTGESSYMWLNSESALYPNHVKLCEKLQECFPKKLNFVICPTSNETKWEANKSQCQKIFGRRFFDDNVSVFRGFKDDVASDSHIWELMCEGQVNDVVREKPEKSKVPTRLMLGLFAAALLLSFAFCGYYYLWTPLRATYEELQKDSHTKQAEIQKLQKDIHTKQAEHEKCKTDFRAKQAEQEKCQKDSHTKQAEIQKLQKDIHTKQAEHEKCKTDFRAKQAEQEKCQKDSHTKQAEIQKLQKDIHTKQAEHEKCRADNAKLSNDMVGKTGDSESYKVRLQIEEVLQG